MQNSQNTWISLSLKVINTNNNNLLITIIAELLLVRVVKNILTTSCLNKNEANIF